MGSSVLPCSVMEYSVWGGSSEKSFLYHAMNLQFFQLLVDYPWAGIIKVTMKFTRALRAFVQFLNNAAFPFSTNHFHRYFHTAVYIKGIFFLYINLLFLQN